MAAPDMEESLGNAPDSPGAHADSPAPPSDQDDEDMAEETPRRRTRSGKRQIDTSPTQQRPSRRQKVDYSVSRPLICPTRNTHAVTLAWMWALQEEEAGLSTGSAEAEGDGVLGLHHREAQVRPES